MLISNLYVSIFTDFVTSNLLIVIILSDLNCSFQNVFIYLLFMYLFIIFLFIYLFIYSFIFVLDYYNFYSNFKYIK